MKDFGSRVGVDEMGQKERFAIQAYCQFCSACAVVFTARRSSVFEKSRSPRSR
jgi:hypothetical protein